ncbi:MAG: hypothetical protein ACJ786_04220, partial [Catenulispora sp.]
GRAAGRGETAPGVLDVAAAVLSAPDCLAYAALVAVGVQPQDLLAELRASGGPASEAGEERIPVLLARADWERQRANDEAIGSVHLAAALAGLPDAELAPLRAAGIDLDLLRTGVARTPTDVAVSDYAFTPPPRMPVLEIPETPAIAELLTRTPMSRSAAVKQLLDSLLPAGPNFSWSPDGLVRARRWARLHVTHLILVFVALLLALHSAMEWWLYLLLVPVSATPSNLPTPVCLAFPVAGSALWPVPVTIAVVLTVATGAAESWYALWMKRIDLAEPGTTFRDIRRATRQTARKLVLRKLGFDDDD